jgi:hypothetical protein
LGDSVDAVMSLSRKDLRKLWHFEFIGEAGRGLRREWFQLVTQKIFDPDMGLWQSSQVNQMCMQINPASGAYQYIMFCMKHELRAPGIVKLTFDPSLSIVSRVIMRGPFGLFPILGPRHG